MNEAKDLINRASDDGITRVRELAYDIYSCGNRLLTLEEDNLAPGAHDFLDRSICCRKDIMQNASFVGFQALMGSHEIAQLFIRHLLVRCMRVTAENPHHSVRRD